MSTAMVASAQANRLASLGLAAFVPLFSDLEPPDPSAVHGTYRAEFVGPGWLRGIAGPVLTFTGLGGWCGKWFDGHGSCHNLVLRSGEVQAALHMVVREQPSLIDGRLGVAVVYPSDLRFPWPWVVDELRVFEHGILLGMMVITRFGLRRLPAPFLLHATGTAGQFPMGRE